MHLLNIHEPGETPLPHEQNSAVGIDLGTTHSVIALSEGGRVTILRDICGDALIPSVVRYIEDGGVEVGKIAYERICEGGQGIISSIKRLMGRSAEDVNPHLGGLPYKISDTKGGVVRIETLQGAKTPTEISAEILRHLKTRAEHVLGREVSRAVITVPAYFDDAARNATKDAATLAGLEVLRLVNEPTAAALAYGLDNAAEGVYAIYDLGGGTFDISLLKLEKGIFQVLSTGGDTQLGGDDFDHALVKYFLKKAGEQADESRMSHILFKARAVKEALTEKETTALEWQDSRQQITRTEFESLIATYVERTLIICAQALQDAGVEKNDINGVVLVGGSTRIPFVREKVEAFFGKVPLTNVNPDEVVAAGAALQAEGLTQGSDNLLLDVTPLSLGIETMGGLTEKIVYRNTPIPVSATQEFTTYQDGQTGMKMHIVQGEREMVADCRSLARFELTGIPPLVAGAARINVTFVVDADGLLRVSAREITTGKEQSVEVKPSYGLAAEEVEQMLRESIENARHDITVRLLAEVRMEAQRALLEVEAALKADAALLNATEIKAIEAQMNAVRQSCANTDRDAIDYEVQQLGAVTGDFAESRMNNAIGKALKGTSISGYEGEKTDVG